MNEIRIKEVTGIGRESTCRVREGERSRRVTERPKGKVKQRVKAREAREDLYIYIEIYNIYIQQKTEEERGIQIRDRYKE